MKSIKILIPVFAEKSLKHYFDTHGEFEKDGQLSKNFKKLFEISSGGDLSVRWKTFRDISDICRLLMGGAVVAVSIMFSDEELDRLDTCAGAFGLSRTRYFRLLAASVLYTEGEKLSAEKIIFSLSAEKKQCHCELYTYIPEYILKPFEQTAHKADMSTSDLTAAAILISDICGGKKCVSDSDSEKCRPYRAFKYVCSPARFESLEKAITENGKRCFFCSAMNAYMKEVL